MHTADIISSCSLGLACIAMLIGFFVIVQRLTVTAHGADGETITGTMAGKSDNGIVTE